MATLKPGEVAGSLAESGSTAVGLFLSLDMPSRLNRPPAARNRAAVPAPRTRVPAVARTKGPELEFPFVPQRGEGVRREHQRQSTSSSTSFFFSANAVSASSEEK
jgi:hypothetical protein